jgi:hypothetical protein
MGKVQVLHEQVLSKYFTISRDAKGWVSFETLDGEQLAGFQTKRIAKSVDGEHFHFTIGETAKGKESGLDRIIEIIIQQRGLKVIPLPSTDGSSGSNKIYKGFSLNEVSAAELDCILRPVQANIDCLVAPIEKEH